MTEELGLLQPFVWINAFTPESPDKRRVLPLTSSVLVSFTDESLFDIDAAPGGDRSRTGRAKVRLELFDANYTYLETLFLLNKRRIEIEYGWLDQSGKVASSSGVFPVTLTSIKPKFTFQGTQLEVIAVSDLSSTSPPGSIEHFYSTHTFSITFVPDSLAQLYDGRYPHINFVNPVTQQQQEVAISTNPVLQEAGILVFPDLNQPDGGASVQKAAEEALAKADFVNKNQKYTSIS